MKHLAAFAALIVVKAAFCASLVMALGALTGLWAGSVVAAYRWIAG